MLTTLQSIKRRLGIIDAQYDPLLDAAITAVSARFDLETNRTLALTQDFQQEFDPVRVEILAQCYPIQSVSGFELKQTETDDWQQVTAVQYLIRYSCIVSLSAPLSTLTFGPSTARITYTGGYVLPSDANYDQSTMRNRLPPEISDAATEQIAFWFMNREKIGLKTSWPSGEYRQFGTLDLLQSVTSILRKYRRVF